MRDMREVEVQEFTNDLPPPCPGYLDLLRVHMSDYDQVMRDMREHEVQEFIEILAGVMGSCGLQRKELRAGMKEVQP